MSDNFEQVSRIQRLLASSTKVGSEFTLCDSGAVKVRPTPVLPVVFTPRSK
jgi:hypothetical protein